MYLNFMDLGIRNLDDIKDFTNLNVLVMLNRCEDQHSIGFRPGPMEHNSDTRGQLFNKLSCGIAKIGDKS